MSTSSSYPATSGLIQTWRWQAKTSSPVPVSYPLAITNRRG
jgi:hypothetical protein